MEIVVANGLATLLVEIVVTHGLATLLVEIVVTHGLATLLVEIVVTHGLALGQRRLDAHELLNGCGGNLILGHVYHYERE